MIKEHRKFVTVPDFLQLPWRKGSQESKFVKMKIRLEAKQKAITEWFLYQEEEYDKQNFTQNSLHQYYCHTETSCIFQ